MVCTAECRRAVEISRSIGDQPCVGSSTIGTTEDVDDMKVLFRVRDTGWRKRRGGATSEQECAKKFGLCRHRGPRRRTTQKRVAHHRGRQTLLVTAGNRPPSPQ